MEEIKVTDQTKVAEDVSNHIKYDTLTKFLVKPLPLKKVKKEFTVPIPVDKTPKKDKEGVEAVDFNGVKKETREVDCDYREGIVLKVPHQYKDTDIKVGDTIAYPNRAAQYFDLVKDTQIINIYDVVAVVRN